MKEYIKREKKKGSPSVIQTKKAKKKRKNSG